MTGIITPSGNEAKKLYYKNTLLWPQEGAESAVYGIEYDVTIAAPEVIRVGQMDLHASLPVHNKIKRCLLLDNGTVNYYLDANDSTLKADGTPADLTGIDGQVMVEFPEHWTKFETDGNIRRALISEAYFEGSYLVPTFYVSAYKAALHRPTNKLSSVVNLTADYRGGNNQDTWDSEPNSQLGKPVTNTSRIDFRAYAESRGLDSGTYGVNGFWLDMDYQARKSIYWLITIEYATRNHQEAFNAVLTAEGYRQGALGEGPTNISSDDWSTFNGYYPLYNCGLTNSLGNSTGEVPVMLQDFPTAGLTKATPVNSYRGIENFFGDIWECTNGVNVKIEGDVVNAYVANGLNKSDTDYLGYKASGLMPSGNGYISGILFGKHGDILPSSATGGSSTTFFADYWYKGFDGLRGLRFGGYALLGSSAGPAAVHANNSPADARAFVGSRLTYFPNR